MELRTFIAQSLTQIAKAIIEANTSLNGKDAFVNPSNIAVRGRSDVSGGYTQLRMNRGDQVEERTVELIEFDVAVAASEEQSTSGGVSVALSVLGVGGKVKHESTAGSESRIHFSIPMVFPSIRAELNKQ